MRIIGTIIRGAGQAKAAFNLPTINLEFDPAKSKVEPGVYASRVNIEATTYNGITFIGQAHLLEGKPWRVETHCFDHDLPDLAGQRVEVELIKHMRAPVAFTSEEQALTLIADDVKDVRKFFQI